MIDHDAFYGTCDAYELLVLMVRLRSHGLYATNELSLYNSNKGLHV